MIRTYSRFPYRPVYGYVVLIAAILLMSWELQRADAAIAGGSIPSESIRLRILANSDSAMDQLVKREVRDAIVEEMKTWVTGPQTIEEARSTINARIGDINTLIAAKLQARGFHYGYKAELGIVPFPTKIYGTEVYPAGNYEALRITLGAGAGQNWWCVLFPPLCFVDAVSGESSTPATAAVTTAASKAGDTGNDSNKQVDNAANVKQTDAKASAVDGSDNGAPQQPEVKFFLWELLKSIFSFIKHLFS
ncbi:stage II sporulation protein R [Paenibacillus sacheonensis]|uniref:Stage II sporulation protein R n=1 Tax=Paenibacillus sacheonensis TaxID=742054 RepID=A0A7X5C560_9BACL|nr:stage II sporulation protein R [Paenibacillus sacheonensis]MBM7566553.1 stage II sporulation protein R [Paenibacillus sacheonensis]NBC73054.1 stage II sporulation protein R [Paenibacillus sacheonensis]